MTYGGAGYGEVAYGEKAPTTGGGGSSPQSVAGGRAVETDTARPGTAAVGAWSVAGGHATETDTARAGTVTASAPSVAGGHVTEADAARAGTVTATRSVTGGRAVEHDAAPAVLTGGDVLGTLDVDLSTVHIWTGSGSYSGGALHQDAPSEYLEFTVPYAVNLSEDVTVEVDVVRSATGTTLQAYRWLARYPDETPGGTVVALTPHPVITAAAGASLTVTLNLPADYPSGWEDARAAGDPIYLDLGFDRVDHVSAVRITQVNLTGDGGGDDDGDTVAGGHAVETDTANAGITVVASGVSNNRVGGRWRGGFGRADWWPDPVPVAPPEAVDVAQAFTVPIFDPVTGVPLYSVQKVQKPRHLDQIIVGGKDITIWREAPTPLPGYSFVSPGGFGPATLVVPQIHAAFETPGEGHLRFLRIGAPVYVRRRDPETGEVVGVDYRGIITAHNPDGDNWSATVGGDLVGRAALLQQQVPIFRWRVDLGRIAYDAVRRAGRIFDPYLGPKTGIPVMRFGGSGLLEHLGQVSAMGTTRTGRQWTIMPDWSTGRYGMARRDLTTITATVYADDARTVARLSRDAADEPNRIFMTGVTPEGLRVRFGRYPGLKVTRTPPPYPYTDGRTFGIGTQDADTDTGDGITVLANRLFIVKALTRPNIPGGYDADLARAVKTIQRRAGIPATGNMTPRTWRVMYDLGVTGYSLLGSGIGPAAEDDRVRKWDRAPSGALIRRNATYDRSVLPVERNVDAGTGFTMGQLKEWAEAEIEEGATPNYVGSITLNTGAIVKGLHIPGDPITPDDLFRARDLRPGQNLWLPLHSGGLVVHVAAVQVAAGTGIVTADVDTRARDSMAVWEVIARNREAKKSLRHAWIQENRSSTQTKDSTTPWDEVGGVLPDPIDLAGDDWTVFPLIAGQEGTLGWLDMNTNPNAEFVMAIFGDPITERRLRRLIGNPLTPAGSRRWASERIRRILTTRHLMLYVAGSNKEPLGYFPKKKGGEDDNGNKGSVPLTGRWRDEAQIRYFTGKHPVLYVAVFADRDTRVPRGRIAWPQLEAGT